MNAKISLGSITKIINIIFLIVLENYILDSGMGFLGLSFVIYYLLYTIFFKSLQDGIFKMVSIRNSKGMNGNSKRIVKPALLYVLVAGSFITGITYLLLRVFAVKLLGLFYPVPLILILCIVLILNGITDIFCGYHLGNGTKAVAVIIHILKMILPVVLSLLVIPGFSDYGQKISNLLKNEVIKYAYMAMGVATVYATTGLIICFVIIIITLYIRKYSRVEKTINGIDTRRTVAGGFLSIAKRVMMNTVFPVLSISVVLLMYLHFFMKSELTVADAYTNIGVMFTRVLLPVLFIFVIFSEYIAKEKHRLQIDCRKDEFKMVVLRIQYMIKNSFFMLIPPTMILVFLAEPIAKACYNGQVSLAAKYLQTGGGILLVVGLAYALNNIMSAFDEEKKVWIVQGGALAIQILFLLVGLTKTNGNSMMILYSFYIYFGIQVCILFYLIYRSVRIDLLDILLKLGKYGVAGIIMMVLFLMLGKLVNLNLVLILLSVFLGYLLYYLTLLALHGISKKDEAALKRTLNYYPVHFLRSRLRL